jgi:hypothetical protein
MRAPPATGYCLPSAVLGMRLLRISGSSCAYICPRGLHTADTTQRGRGECHGPGGRKGGAMPHTTVESPEQAAIQADRLACMQAGRQAVQSRQAPT